MYDKIVVLADLDDVEGALQTILEWTSHVVSVDDFLYSQDGMILLDAVCMKLIAVGEKLKAIDKRTGKTLFPEYPSIP
ncbi:hypothetical protein Barb6_00081 [Bacteroidales bacterium Barb6]|nr:hypothetical protein Barb6_00081 [Bacteroidales bacterium Barb6]